MPITKSAEKALRQSIRRRAQNIKRKDAYKNAVKIVRKLVLAGRLKSRITKLFAKKK